MKVEFELPFTEEELAGALKAADQGNAVPLRFLCRKEVERFDGLLRTHPHYREGLAPFEMFVVQGYLYQKLRGHVDEAPQENPNNQERQNGPA